MSDKDFTDTKVERAIDYAKDYIVRVEELQGWGRKREVQAWLPLVLHDLSAVAENYPKMTDKSLKSDFVSVTSTLIDHEKEYDPNPGKTRSSVDWIKSYLPL
jgi:hypothetical protein|tara:strand:+ start:45137 stop:45442 length:306 start_codon:yes stop_codon:yes gene_type:complete